MAGCVGDPTSVATADEEALFARNSFDNTAGTDTGYVAPFSAAHIERSMFHARVVARNPAFRQCVINTMYSWYTYQDGDPLPGASVAAQTTEALARLENYGNPIHFRDYEPIEGAAAAAFVGQDTWGTNEIFTYVYDETHGDWSWYGTGTGWSAGAYEPWNWRASDMIHEYMHARGYSHTTIDSGDTSVPYIFGVCADVLIRASDAICGAGSLHSCGPDELRLRNVWDNTSHEWQSQTTGGCGCYADPRHVVALRSYSGAAVTAYLGGGSSLPTNWGSAIGAWQWFYAYDRNGGAWNSGDTLSIRSFNGSFVRRSGSSFWANGAVSEALQMYRVGAWAPLGDGEVVRLLSGSYWAYDTGTSVGASTSSSGTSRYFTIVEPRRDHLVYLRTAHSTTTSVLCDADGDDNPADPDNDCYYVNKSPTAYTAYNDRTDTELGAAPHTSPGDENKAAAAF